jgi:hypothetical protein
MTRTRNQYCFLALDLLDCLHVQTTPETRQGARTEALEVETHA